MDKKQISGDLTFKFVTSNINELVNSSPFDFGFASSGEYVVDDSHFVPMSEAVKQLGINNSAGSQGLYDFDNGKDNGMDIPLSRRKGITLAEISTELEQNKSSIRDVIEKERIYERQISDFEKGLESSSSSGAE